jgi:hypothetical protein
MALATTVATGPALQILGIDGSDKGAQTHQGVSS